MGSLQAREMEELYVYAGENMPRVRLCLLRRYSCVEEVEAYVGRVQDRYTLRLGTVETITGNLKIGCDTHAECEACPFYILEYNEVTTEYSLWKAADADWRLDSIVATMYTGAGGPARERGALPRALQGLREGLDREYVWDCVRRLNLPLEQIDWAEFRELLESMLAAKGVADDDCVTLRGVVALAALQATVQTSKRAVRSQLRAYDSRVRAAATPASTRTSSPESLLPADSRESSVSSVHYTYGLPATQLDANFKAYFRSMAENFELFEEPATALRGRVAKPRKKPAGRQGHRPVQA
ncbi:AaceriAAL180Cp [[Ashbya] aceris (nom. inval.)]|nr:AaceriAAL180Cp [[Ashbya] aceris (nom. inval.)]